MTSGTRVVVIGTGAFATAFAKALVSTAATPPHLILLGRTEISVRTAVNIVGSPAEGQRVDLGPDTDLIPILHAVAPRLIVVAASLHSPYSARRDQWSALLSRAGFGLTALLQAPVAIRVAQAAAALEIPLINACYPDLVNPLLAAVGLPVLCGLGNAHTLTAGIGRPAPMLAHHRHLTQPTDPTQDVMMLDPADEPRIRQALTTLRRQPRRQLNDLGATAGGALVTAMIEGRTEHTNLPGPMGLPGGYPVEINGLACRPTLPPDQLDHAVSWNRRHSRFEGVVIDGDALLFSGATLSALRELGVITTDRLPCQDWRSACQRLLAARTRLGC